MIIASSNFQELNQELTQAQNQLEDSIRASRTAQEALEIAEIELIKAQSAYKKAKLDEKLYTQRLNTAQEKSRNLRKEASI